MEKSSSLMERARKVIPGGVNSPVRSFRSVGGTPFVTEKASGAYLTTVDGQELIDFVCTWGPAIHGHKHPFIAEAIGRALEKGTSFGTPNAYEVEMAEKLVETIASVEKVRMVNSGTEATMSAIRLARGYTGRDKIIKFEGCYHGHVDALLVKAGSGALTLGQPDSLGIPKSFSEQTLVLPFNDLPALEKCLIDYPVAAVILEPYPANCGLILPDAEYLKEVRRLCTQHKTVLIFDEVMTGFRVRFGGVQEKEAIMPDLSCFGKIIGGGLPVGAFGGKAEIMDHLAPIGGVYQAGTLSGNPLALSAGLAAMELLETINPYPRLESLTKDLANELLMAAKEAGLPLQVPHTTSMFSLFFTDKKVRNYEEAISSQGSLFKKLFHHCLANGVYLPPSPYETCFISTAHTKEILDKAIDVITTGLRKL